MGSRVRQILTVISLWAIRAAHSANDGWTRVHEPGRCALRGLCGRDGLFGPDLPCPDNQPAREPSSQLRSDLVALCGPKWAEIPVCCVEDQFRDLKSNLEFAEQFVAGCPACKDNFFNHHCSFTCSPDQSVFLNVTKSHMKDSKLLVEEVDYLVSENYGRGFYDSCKEVKFGSGLKAMDLIGGGAHDYQHFLNFMGQKRFAGSPFQINYPPIENGYPGMHAMDTSPFRCNGTDERYRCACQDCSETCPVLSEVPESHYCHFGGLPCLSFASITIYGSSLALMILAVIIHVIYMRGARAKNERLQLLRDMTPSVQDDEETEFANSRAILDSIAKEYKLHDFLHRKFYQLGLFCADYPLLTILTSLAIVTSMSMGWANFSVEKDPVRLWVAPDSEAAQQKEFFDSTFGRFHRIEQAILSSENSPAGPVPILSYENLEFVFDFEERVKRIRGDKFGKRLEDVCYKPMGDLCAVQSITGWFQESFERVDPDDWGRQISECAAHPVECLPLYGQPLNPNLIIGGNSTDVLESQAIITTWVIRNHFENSKNLTYAIDWEESLRDLMIEFREKARERGLRLSFSTEISVEEELNKTSSFDSKIIVLSYIIMFLYASLTLGISYKNPGNFPRDVILRLVRSKFMLGSTGILILLMSVSASVGLFSGFGIKATLIIAQVIPFLVLAVGVDNIFLIVSEFENANMNYSLESIPERVGRSLGCVGPGILLSALTQFFTFGLSIAVKMPAVRNFAIYATGAIFMNFILQITMFVAVMALNQRRVEAGRVDCFPCLQMSSPDSFGASNFRIEEEAILDNFIRVKYAPLLSERKVKVLVLSVFLGLFAAGIALIPEVELGLDQSVAIPQKSYLTSYFTDVTRYLQAGPPVYFVSTGLNATERHAQKEICGRFLTCEQYSISNILEEERKRSEISMISDPPAVWLDDFFSWLDPALTECCTDGIFPCFYDRDPPYNRTLSGMPQGEEFLYYLDRWLQSPPTSECALGGKASYENAILVDKAKETVNSFHVRTAHVPLRSQKDFISAYQSARRIANEITEESKVKTYAYSSFYIYFDQYVSIIRLSSILLGSSVGVIFLLTSFFLGSLRTGLVVTLTVAMIIIDMIGSMAILGVSLNALSLVNLIISSGIGFEFCAHIARAFGFSSRTILEQIGPQHRLSSKEARSWGALISVGPSVFSGIAMTKLLGVSVLAFTRSKIFEIYYFRMWISLVFLASIHAFIFLPVALSLFGGSGFLGPESDGGLERNLRSRIYSRILTEEDYQSDEI